MAVVQKKQYSMDDYKAGYGDITVLYDYADELLSTVEAAADKGAQLRLIEPLINDISETTDVLSEEFISVAESNKPYASQKFNKKRIETALRHLFTAVVQYEQYAAQMAENIAAPIISKIKQQIDKIVVLFVEFAQISLQNIMSKAEIEAIKQRDTRIAIMMHQISLAQHGSNH